jgi:hypothetical protein
MSHKSPLSFVEFEVAKQTLSLALGRRVAVFFSTGHTVQLASSCSSLDLEDPESTWPIIRNLTTP